MKIELNLDESGLKQTLSASILASISQEQRESIMRAAVSYLITPEKVYGGSSESPLEMAFYSAVRTLAVEVVRESIREDEGFKEKLQTIYREAVERFFETNREDTVNRLAGALAASFN